MIYKHFLSSMVWNLGFGNFLCGSIYVILGILSTDPTETDNSRNVNLYTENFTANGIFFLILSGMFMLVSSRLEKLAQQVDEIEG